MSTAPKPKTKSEMKKSAYKTMRETYRTVLRHLILRKNFSIFDAANKYDIDECAAENVLFDKKPTPRQIAYALEIYDKGLSVTIACVAAGVPLKVFKKALRERSSTEYRPKRW
jgi:hypothetical protein